MSSLKCVGVVDYEECIICEIGVLRASDKVMPHMCKVVHARHEGEGP